MKKRLFATFFGIAALIAVLAGCGGGGAMSEDFEPWDASAPQAIQAPPMPVLPEDSLSMAPAAEEGVRLAEPPIGAPPIITPELAAGRMFVYTVEYRLQTTEFMPGVRTLLNTVAAHGGHTLQMRIEGHNLRTPYTERLGYFHFRVPSENISNFIEELERHFNIWMLNLTGVERTRAYQDHGAAVDYARERYGRLLEALEEAETTAERLNIERQIASAQQDIRVGERTMAAIEDNVIYSDITAMLHEVIFPPAPEPAPVLTFVERMSETLEATGLALLSILQNIVLFLTAAFPVIFVLALVVLAARVGRRIYKRHWKNKKQGDDAP